MKISINWLKRHINLDIATSIIADKLTFAGLEVEHIAEHTQIKGGLSGIVVGEVVGCEKHPDADRLKVTKVNVGNDDLLDIVCGAPNVALGQKVLVAKVGATIYPIKGEPIVIKTAKIRGQLSQGMICAEDEIGLGESHEGILVLPEDTPIGIEAAQYFNITTNTVLDIGLTANRGDAASHLGVARDLSALFNIPLIKKSTPTIVAKNKLDFEINLKSADCGRYCGVLICNVHVAKSPAWLIAFLENIGISSINNIVDATNFVLHDVGQPIHAFDADKIAGNIINVRNAESGEKMITLDSKERILSANDLVIADCSKPLALAGVFGGLESGISNDTKNIFIESAYFDAASIRKTAKKFGLNTDASFRYERGANPEICMDALLQTADLVLSLAGGNIGSNFMDVYPKPIEPHKILLKLSQIKRVLGIEVPIIRIIEILTHLEIEITEQTDEALYLLVPAFKADVTREIDVIEEIIRIYGFDNIPLKGKSTLFINNTPSDKLFEAKKKLSGIMQGLGFTEIMNNSLVSENERELQSIAITNPLSTDTALLRTSLNSGMLDAISYNIKRKNTDLKFYEIGTVFKQINGKFIEEYHLSLGLVGNVYKESWQFTATKVNASFLFNIIQELMNAFGINDVKKIKNCLVLPPSFVENKVLKNYDINNPVVLATLSINKLIQLATSSLSLQDIAIFPSMRRELSLVVDKKVKFSEVEKITQKVAGSYLTSINVVDVFEGKPLSAEKKSYSVSFIWQNIDRTLEDKEIDPIANKLIEQFEKELGAIIRR